MATLTELAGYIESNGLGTGGVDLFVASYPNEPANLIALTQPRPGVGIHTMKKTLDHVVEAFTLTVRNEDPELAHDKAWAVFLLLDNFTGTISGIEYKLISGRGIPFSLGHDENRLTRWSCDFLASKAVS